MVKGGHILVTAFIFVRFLNDLFFQIQCNVETKDRFLTSLSKTSDIAKFVSLT